MEYNKVFAAVLTAGIAFSALRLVADDTVHPHRLEKSALDIKGADEPTAATPAAAAPIPPIAPLLVKANPADGEAFTKKVCVACHNFQEGAGAKVGPDLYGVVGRPEASAAGFDYSAALKSHHGVWTYAELNKWLLKPAGYAPGTKMAYAGISNDQMRADVIDYLHTLSPNPEPLPTAAEAAKEEAEAKSAAAKASTATPPAAEGASAASPALPPVAPLLATADLAHGESMAKKVCTACHNLEEGAGAKIGPDLYGVVGREQASVADFTYSSALKSHHGKWNFDQLNQWLDKPSAYAPGTKMAYAGISNAQTRADVIDYLHTLSHDPLPLPKAGNESSAAPGAASPQATPPGNGETKPN